MVIRVRSAIMDRSRALPLLALTWIGTTMPAGADALRCGARLVAEGDTRAAVESRCGPPADVVRRTRLAPAIVWRDGRPYRVGHGLIDVVVEEWFYDFGPQRFVRRVRFEDGVVVRIDTLGYGQRAASATD